MKLAADHSQRLVDIFNSYKEPDQNLILPKTAYMIVKATKIVPVRYSQLDFDRRARRF